MDFCLACGHPGASHHIPRGMSAWPAPRLGCQDYPDGECRLPQPEEEG